MSLPGRTTTAAILGILTVKRGITSLDMFIDPVNEIVTGELAGLLKLDFKTIYYTEYRLELIERWLSAHFYTVFDRRRRMEQAGSVEASYESKVDLGFDSSTYGQMAMRIETYGRLAAMNNAMKKQELRLLGARYPILGGLQWLGTPYNKTLPLPDEF